MGRHKFKEWEKAYMGLHWYDMKSSDNETKKLMFYLLKKGKLTEDELPTRGWNLRKRYAYLAKRRDRLYRRRKKVDLIRKKRLEDRLTSI